MLVTSVTELRVPENPVAPTWQFSPIIKVPWVTNPLITLPLTLVTVSLAVETTPTRLLPILGKIPLVNESSKSLVACASIVTLTYFTLAGGLGGSANTIESPWTSKEVFGVCATPLRTIRSWSPLAITFSPLLTVSGNWVLTPSNWPEMSSNLWTTEVKIFSDDVSLFWRNNTSVLLNSE